MSLYRQFIGHTINQLYRLLPLYNVFTLKHYILVYRTKNHRLRYFSVRAVAEAMSYDWQGVTIKYAVCLA